MATYVVQQGDCLSSIAARFGYDTWKEIWNAPANAEFKKKRKNPNVLFPGDKLELPEHQPKSVSLATGQRHKLVIERQTAKLKLRFLHNGRPLAQEPYQLVLGEKVVNGSTDGDGGIEHDVPFELTSAKCTLTRRQRTFDLKVGALDPADEVSGAQARLKALGGFGGGIDGSPSDELALALRFFQAAVGIEASGNLDGETAGQLEKLFGV